MPYVPPLLDLIDGAKPAVARAFRATIWQSLFTAGGWSIWIAEFRPSEESRNQAMIQWHPRFTELPDGLRPQAVKMVEGVRLPTAEKDLEKALSSLIGAFASATRARTSQRLTRRDNDGEPANERKGGASSWKTLLKAWLQVVTFQEAVSHAKSKERAKVVEVGAALAFIIEKPGMQVPLPAAAGADDTGTGSSTNLARFDAWIRQHRPDLPTDTKAEDAFRRLEKLLWHDLSERLGWAPGRDTDRGEYLLHDIGRTIAGLLVAVDADTSEEDGVPQVMCHGGPDKHPALALRLASLDPADDADTGEVERYSAHCQAHADQLQTLIETRASLPPGGPVRWPCCKQRYQVRLLPDWVREVSEQDGHLQTYLSSILTSDQVANEKARHVLMAGVEAERLTRSAEEKIERARDGFLRLLEACWSAVPLEGGEDGWFDEWFDGPPDTDVYTAVQAPEYWGLYRSREPWTVKPKDDAEPPPPLHPARSAEDDALRKWESERLRAVHILHEAALWPETVPTEDAFRAMLRRIDPDAPQLPGSGPSEDVFRAMLRRLHDDPLRETALRVTLRYLARGDASWWDDLLNGVARGVRALPPDWQGTRYFYRKRLQQSHQLTIARVLVPAARFGDALHAMYPDAHYLRELEDRARRDQKSEKRNENSQINRGRKRVELAVVSPANLIADAYFAIVYQLAEDAPGLIGKLLYRIHEAGGLETQRSLDVIEAFLGGNRTVSTEIDLALERLAELDVRDERSSRPERIRWALAALERLLVYRHIYYFAKNPVEDWSKNLPSLREQPGGAQGRAGATS